jgi:hypothetical protein
MLLFVVEVHMLPTLIAAILAVATRAPARAHPEALGEVYFTFDSAELSATGRARLAKAADYALANPSARLVLDAHCDPIGTGPYNVGLSVRRAESVRAALIEKGVPDPQIVLAFFGKDGALRANHAEDRRVTIWRSRQSLDHVIARTFANRGTGVTWGKPMTVAELAAPPESVAIK